MAARRDERDERRLELGIVEHRGVHVPFVMIDADVRPVGHQRERLGRAHAHEERAREPRPVARGNRVDLAERDAGFDQRELDDLVHQLDVRAARNLGHDPTEWRVPLHLGRDGRRDHVAPAGNDRGGGLVTRRLDTEHQACTHHARGGSTMVEPGTLRSSDSSSAPYSGSSTLCAHMMSASSFVST